MRVKREECRWGIRSHRRSAIFCFGVKIKRSKEAPTTLTILPFCLLRWTWMALSNCVDVSFFPPPHSSLDPWMQHFWYYEMTVVCAHPFCLLFLWTLLCLLVFWSNHPKGTHVSVGEKRCHLKGTLARLHTGPSSPLLSPSFPRYFFLYTLPICICKSHKRTCARYEERMRPLSLSSLMTFSDWERKYKMNRSISKCIYNATNTLSGCMQQSVRCGMNVSA